MRVNFVNGYKIHAFESKREFLNYIADKKKILIAMNAEKIVKDDKRLKDIVNNNIAYSDGVGAVMALKQKGVSSIKIAGAEFWLDIIREFYDRKSFYLIGSTDAVIKKTVKKLKRDFNGINIIGYRNGYLSQKDIKNLEMEILFFKPDIIFVAQGSPKQEFLMDDLYEKYKALYMGLGGSFDVYCGLKKRAPNIFIKLYLEWFYRLVKEPFRIFRQLLLFKFIFLLYRKKI